MVHLSLNLSGATREEIVTELRRFVTKDIPDQGMSQERKVFISHEFIKKEKK